MIDQQPYQLLQIIGLSLPFLALYLTVLVEIHKFPKPIRVASRGEGSPAIHEVIAKEVDKEWAGTVALSYAYQNYDFVFALVSIVLIVFSALSILLNIILHIGSPIGLSVILLVLSYVSMIVSVLFTLVFCYNNFSPSDE